MNARTAPLFRGRRAGFTLLEMMITLAVFVLLCAAVFGLMSGVLDSTAALQDNHDRRDQVAALNTYLKNQLGEMSARSTLVSYLRGTGDGLNQNGILFGTANFATAIDAEVQPNGYYNLRVATFATEADPSQPQDARTSLLQLVTAGDPTVSWTTLIKDVKTLDWKFQELNVTDWVEVWTTSPNPNLMEFTMQMGGDVQPTTMDFWIPLLSPSNIRIQANSSAAAGSSSTNRNGNPAQPGRTAKPIP